MLASSIAIPKNNPKLKILVSEEVNFIRKKKKQDIKTKEGIQLQEISPKTNKSNDLKINLLRSVFDSCFRGLVRYPETFFENKYFRILYRLATESMRKTSEVLFVNSLAGKKVTTGELKESLIKALEHVPATAVLEPNMLDNHFQRIFAGFGNIALRFLTRLGFYKAKAISKEGLGLESVLDDFLSRTFLRAVYVNSSNPAIGIAVRTLEQLLINLNLHVFQVANKLFPGFSNFLKAKGDS